MCRSLKAAYIKNGGSDLRLLAQLTAVEKKAVAVKNIRQPNHYLAGIFITIYYICNCVFYLYVVCCIGMVIYTVRQKNCIVLFLP